MVGQTFGPNVRAATAADIAELGFIGPAAYAAEYAYLWDSSAAFARQLATFSSEAFARLMERPDTRIWIAQIDDAIVGFLTMILGSDDPIERRANGAEIPRVYLLPGSQGRGIGRQLVESAIAQARAAAASYVWLDVMASATQARSAYLRWGFAELGKRRFIRPVKSDFADMVVFAKPIA